MAATLVPSLAWDSAFSFIKQPGPLVNVRWAILQDASSHLWHLAPWRWSIGALASVAVTNAQEFTFTKPADFLRLERAWLVTTEGSQPLAITALEPVMTRVGTPKTVAYVSNSGDKLRFDSVFPPSATNTPTIKALYKKTAPDLRTDFSTAGALVMDDDYFYIYRSLVLYHAYKWADDPRAGGAQLALAPNSTRPQVSYSGQLAAAMAEIEELRLRDPSVFMLDDAPFLKRE